MSSHTPATHKVEIRRLDGTSHSADKGYLEMKDPSVIRMEDGSYQMYCSLGTSTTQQCMRKSKTSRAQRFAPLPSC
jgi:hypothetical protein